MTAQDGDFIIIDGQSFRLNARPLYSLFEQIRWRPTLQTWSTANRAGYTARWEIIDARLYLTGVVGFDWSVPTRLRDQIGPDPDPFDRSPGAKNLRLTDLFPDEASVIPATWVTEVMYAPTGGRRVSIHAGFASLYASYRLMNVVSGRVRQMRELSSRQWAERVGLSYPDEWFDEEPEEFEDSEPEDWHAVEHPSLRYFFYQRAQLDSLASPCGHVPDRRIPWPRWRDQRRRARLWLTEGRR